MTTSCCLELRPLQPSDREALAEMFARLSPESLYRRFWMPTRGLPPEQLERIVAADHVNHEPIVAVNLRDGSIVGGCRYVRDVDRPAVAELALTVADEWHGMGIGTALADEVLHRARANGVSVVIAMTLVNNRPARRLLRRAGFRVVSSEGGRLELRLELDAYTRPRPAARLSAAELGILRR